MNSESLGNEDSGKSEEVSLMIPLGIEDNAVQLEVMMNDDENSQTNSLLQGTTESASTSSCLLKSDCGQFYLVTYDKEDRVISKHHINLQCDGTEDFLGLGYVSNPPISINAVDSSMQDPVSIMANNQEEKLQAGDTLQLAMQEIENDVSLLEPVSYEVKLAAMTAMLPKSTTPGMTYDCPICSSVHFRLYDLKCHLSRHFGLSLYLCSFCGRQFTNSSNLIRHTRIHSGDKPYRCKDCGKRFNQANGLATHREYLHPSDQGSKHSCPLCGRQYKSMQLLKRHCKGSHQDGVVELNSTPSTTSKRQFYCPDCGESFDRKLSLKEHREAKHAPDCGSSSTAKQPGSDVVINPTHLSQTQENEMDKDCESLDSIDSMLREIRNEALLDDAGTLRSPVSAPQADDKVDTYIQSIEEVIDKVNRLICLECGRQFQRYLSYKQHWGVHEASLRKFECEDCGLSFAWKSTYMKHVAQSHSSSPPSSATCTEPGCNKQYKSIAQLQEHVKRDHLLIRRFECDECGKQFYKAHDLLVHKRTHSQEKPYICGQCGKAFSHLSHVIRHEKSHNNIRPYKCQHCLKAFTQATVLRAHKCKKLLAETEVLNEVDSGKQLDDAVELVPAVAEPRD